MQGGGMMSFYGEMPDSFNLVINTAHPLIEKLVSEEETATEAETAPFNAQLGEMKNRQTSLKDSHKGKKDEEISSEEKEELESLQKKIDELTENKKNVYRAYAADNKQVRQLIDLALLANNMLKGEALAKFVKRSVELM